MKPMMFREKLFAAFLCSGIAFAAVLLFVGDARALIRPEFTVAVDPPIVYRGDAVIVAIIPTNFNASSTVFEWRLDTVLDAGQSGLGRDKYSFVADAPETFGSKLITVRLSIKPGGDFTETQRTVPIPVITLPETRPAADGDLSNALPDGINGIRNVPHIDVRSVELLALPSNNPDPGETVTVSVRSSDIDLDRSSFRWSVNGAIPRDAQQGIGAKSYSFAAGKTGTNYSVSVTVTPPAGAALSKTTAVRSFDMPMYWWADSVAPAWFRGKTLPSVGSETTVAALPNLPGVNPKTLLYSWEFNNNFIGSQSGIGKNTFRFAPQFAGVRETVKVRVQNANGSIDKEGTAVIPEFEPFVRVYEFKPLEGVEFIRALTVRAARGGETIDVVAEPFFFPLRNLADLAFRWRVNGADVASAAERPEILTVQSEENTRRRHSFSVLVENKQKNAQKTEKKFEIDFK